MVRFAKSGSGTKGLRFRKIIKDISNVGLVKIIVTLIVIYIIALALTFVIGLNGLIPHIGIFIGIIYWITVYTIIFIQNNWFIIC